MHDSRNYFFSSGAGGSVGAGAGASEGVVAAGGSVGAGAGAGGASAQPNVDNPRPTRAASISSFFMFLPRKSFIQRYLHRAGHPCLVRRVNLLETALAPIIPVPLADYSKLS